MSQKFKTKIRDLPVSSLPRSAWLSLFLIGLITLLGMSAANFYNHRTETQALATVADKLTKEIRDNINSYQYGLLGLRGAVLTAGLDNMTRQQYFTYFDSRDMFKEFPGIRGMGVLRKVPSDKLKQFADLMQKKGQPPFVFRSIGTSHGDRYLVEFFEPKEIGDTILGLDLGSEANRRQAADVAGRTGSAALSAPIQLIVDKSKVESFLLMLPIYAGAQHIINEQEREQHVQGWSYATLSIRDVLRNVQHEQKGVQLKIEDVTDSTTSVLFNPPLPPGTTVVAGLEAQREVNIYGRNWRYSYQAMPAFIASLKLIPLWLIGGSGALLMLALLTYHMLRSREAQQILALHKMRDQYALIVEGSSDGIIGKNLQGVVTSWNPAAERIFGYSAEEAVGHKLFDLVFPDDTEEEELAILRDIAAGKAVPDHEAVRVRKDGSLVFVSVAISPIWNLSGEIIGASKTVRDITALRDAEHAVANINAKLEMEVLRRTSVLRDAQEALRTVLDALPSMIGYWDCNLINRVANKAYERWFGVSADQITGQCLISLLGPELYEQNRPYIEKVLRGEAQTFERMIEHRDGSVRFALSHYLPDMADGEVRGFFVVVHDITEISESRIRLANSLHENEVLLGTINQQLLYSVADEQGMFIEVNDMFCQSMGYGREALIGHDHKIVQSGVHDAAFYRQMWAALMKGQAWRGELCNRCQNGVLKWFDTVIAPLGEETSGSKRFLALQIDITDRRQAMAEVDRLNLMLRNVLDAASEISIIATDADGTIALFNRGAERMLGYSADEMIGKQTPAIIHDAAEIHQRGEELSQQYGEPVEGFRVFVHVPERDGAEIHDWTYIRKDQHRLTVSLAATAMRDAKGKLTGFLGIATDITRMKQQQQELAAARDQMLLAAEVAHLGVWSWDVLDNTLIWNAEMYYMYEQPPELARSGLKYLHWRERVHPEDVLEAESHLQRAIDEEDDYDTVFRIIWRNGEIRYIKASAYIERDSHGRAIRVIGVNLDITASKTYEADILAAKQAAEAANNTKSQFLANMSHEIRTPLNAMLGMLQLLRQTTLSAKQEDYAVKAQIAARSLLALLNDILDFSKIEAGKLQLDIHEFSPEELMQDLGVILSGNVGDKNVEILFDIDPDLPARLTGDRQRLQQVLINLAGNAIKFTQHGHVIVALHCSPLADDRVSLHFSVSDTGIGISDEQKQKIFEGFTQAHSSISRRYGGSGLGLTISKHLVQMMGGDLQLESELGKGSRFHFEIPGQRGEHVVMDRQALLQALEHAPRVMIVDDNPAAQTIMQEMVRGFGWQPLVARSGEDALDMLADSSKTDMEPDVFIIDWRLPGMDGHETARRLRRRTGIHREAVYILISAFGQPILNSSETNTSKYFSAALTKPFTPEQLFDAVTDGMGMRVQTASAEAPFAQIARTLQGLAVLVVEDNALNRQVAAELLQSSGATVLLAEGGQEGVAMAVQHQHALDIIIMDMHMPDCDGLEATRRIRQQLPDWHIPIIAMTANTSNADRELCMAAGMDDFISKPMDLGKLSALIMQVLHGPGTPDHKPDLPTVLTDKLKEPVPDEIERWEAIMDRFAGNAAAYASTFLLFGPEVERHITEIEQCIAMQDRHGLLRHLHSLKGISATLGAAGLARQLAGLETGLKQEGSTLALVDIEALRGTAEHAALLLQQVVNQYHLAHATDVIVPVQSPSVFDWTSAMQELQVMLQQANMQAIDKVGVLLRETPPEQIRFVESLYLKINALEFDEASRLIALHVQQGGEDE